MFFKNIIVTVLDIITKMMIQSTIGRKIKQVLKVPNFKWKGTPVIFTQPISLANTGLSEID